jgi:hypothetical protein
MKFSSSVLSAVFIISALAAPFPKPDTVSHLNAPKTLLWAFANGLQEEASVDQAFKNIYYVPGLKKRDVAEKREDDEASVDQAFKNIYYVPGLKKRDVAEKREDDEASVDQAFINKFYTPGLKN